MNKSDLPIYSTGTLLKATGVACVLASVAFVSIVLPAEYNIDPTGIGEALGLTVLAAPADAQLESATVTDLSNGERSDETTILVPANSGLEYKFHLAQFAKLSYEWDSEDSELYFDLHGEPDEGKPGYFESYAEATGSEMKGSFIAPFAGSHGWYWRNRNKEDVVVTLKTTGDYEVIGLK